MEQDQGDRDQGLEGDAVDACRADVEEGFGAVWALVCLARKMKLKSSRRSGMR